MSNPPVEWPRSGPIETSAELKAQLLERMRSGDLPAGARLPTVRGLADELGLAPNTVARAYRELEQAGAIETRGRNGTFVALSEDATTRAAQEAAAAYVARLRELGVRDADIQRYTKDALAAGRAGFKRAEELPTARTS